MVTNNLPAKGAFITNDTYFRLLENKNLIVFSHDSGTKGSMAGISWCHNLLLTPICKISQGTLCFFFIIAKVEE